MYTHIYSYNIYYMCEYIYVYGDIYVYVCVYVSYIDLNIHLSSLDSSSQIL